MDEFSSLTFLIHALVLIYVAAKLFFPPFKFSNFEICINAKN